MQRLTVEEFREAPKMPLVVVLDDVRSMHNVGSVLRTADAFRISEVVLCGITGRPPHAEIHKTALGAEDSVSWRYVPSIIDAVKQLKDEDYKVLAVEQAEGSTLLHQFQPAADRRYAVILGNEVKGFDRDVTIRDVVATYIYPNTLRTLRPDLDLEVLDPYNFFHYFKITSNQ